MKTVLITGGSGLVGQELTKILINRSYRVIWLSQRKNLVGIAPSHHWDYTKKEIDTEALKQADIVIHLAGENIGSGRWTTEKKDKIIKSRVESANLLLETLKALNKTPDVFISASAVGIYGNSVTDEIFEEKDVPDVNDFLAIVSREWEKAALRFKDELNCRTVMLRTGMVLSESSPAFKKILFPAKFGLGAPMGNGKQYMSWIHIQDLCELYIKAIEDTSMQGAYNAVAPQHITNAEFMKAFAKVLHRIILLPFIPTFLIRLMLGEAADMVLGGSRISSDKILGKGYTFQYPEVEKAIQACLKK